MFSRFGTVSRIFTVLHGALVTRLPPSPPPTPSPVSLRWEERSLFAKVSSQGRGAWLPNSGLASVASPQGLQAGRGGCLTAGSMPLLSLELAASPVHPLFQRLPRHPFGSTPHPEQPSIATNDSLGSQGWLATGPQGRAGPEWDAPPTPSHRSWGTKGPREAAACR